MIQKNERMSKVFALNTRLCKACGICYGNCPSNALSSDKSGRPIADMNKCVRCFLCEMRCPDFAIRFVDKKMD